MSSKGVITVKIGEAFVELVTDGKKLTAGLNDAEKQVIASTNAMSAKLKSIGTVMTAVGGVVIAAFTALIYKTVEAGDKMNDMSLRTGVVVEELSALSYAAKQSGTDIEGVELGIKFLTKAMDDAAKGTGTAKDTFASLGVSVKNLDGTLRPTVEVMKDIATKIAAIDDPARQAAIAMELFGARSGTQLVPLLKLGGAGIDELMKKAEELGIVMSTKDAQAADEFKDAMGRLTLVLGTAGRDIANILIPPLKDFIEKATEMIKKARDWADAHKPLIDILVKVAAAVGVLGAVGGPILLAVSAFMKMIPAIQAVQTALLTLASGGTYGLIITAVAAFVLAYKNNFLGLKTITDDVIDWIVKKYEWYIEKTNKFVADISAAFITEAQATAESAKNIELFSKSTEELLKKTEELAPAFQLVANASATAGVGIKAMANDFGSLSKGLKEKITDTLKTISDRLYELTHTDMENQIKKIDDLKKAYLAMGAPIKQVEDWYNEEIKKLKELEDAESGAIEKKKTLADAYKTVADRIFELTHTEMETNIRKLQEQKQAYIDLGMSIEEANKWLAAEIAKLNELNPELDKTKDKLKEAGIAAEQAGSLGGNSWEGFTTQIKHATTALNNFTKEGVAAAVASIYMKFQPALTHLREDLKTTGFILNNLVQAQIKNVERMINEQIAQIYKGWEVYQEVLGKLNKTGGSTSSLVGSYQTGTSYVPKTGLAIVHQGEKIIPAGQNTTNNSSYSPSIVVNVSGNGNVTDIKRAVEQALKDSSRQFLRKGSELAFG